MSSWSALDVKNREFNQCKFQSFLIWDSFHQWVNNCWLHVTSLFSPHRLFRHLDDPHDNRRDETKCCRDALPKGASEHQGMETARRKTFSGRTADHIFSFRFGLSDGWNWRFSDNVWSSFHLKPPSEQQRDSETQDCWWRKITAVCWWSFCVSTFSLFPTSPFAVLLFASHLDWWKINREIFAHEINIPSVRLWQGCWNINIWKDNWQGCEFLSLICQCEAGKKNKSSHFHYRFHFTPPLIPLLFFLQCGLFTFLCVLVCFAWRLAGSQVPHLPSPAGIIHVLLQRCSPKMRMFTSNL